MASGTILLVDGDAESRVSAHAMLLRASYFAIAVSDGETALAAYESARPVGVVLGGRLPKLDGFALCRRIRELDGGDTTAIVFLTAQRDVETYDRAQAAGCDDFLPALIAPDEFAMRMMAALKFRQMQGPEREVIELFKSQRDHLVRRQLQNERLNSFLVHDLKTPLNLIDLHAQVMLDEDGLSRASRKGVTRIRAESKKLNRMALDLLDITKVAEGGLHVNRRQFDLAVLVRRVFFDLSVLARQRMTALHMDASVTSISGDEELLGRMLTNLVENALQRSPCASAVTVSAARQGFGVELRVADNGPGVAKELRQRIFEPFFQERATASPAPRIGHGLGLTFCREVAYAHGGSIRVDDGNPGAVFCVRLAG